MKKPDSGNRMHRRAAALEPRHRQGSNVSGKHDSGKRARSGRACGVHRSYRHSAYCRPVGVRRLCHPAAAANMRRETPRDRPGEQFGQDTSMHSPDYNMACTNESGD